MGQPAYCTALARVDDRLTATAPGPAPMSHAAFTAIIERIRPWLVRIIKDSGVPEDDIEDALQDVLLRAWTAAPRFDPTRSKPITFFGHVARQVLAGRRKAFATSGPPTVSNDRPELEPGELADDPARQAEAAEETADDGRAVAAATDRLAAVAERWLDCLGPSERILFDLLAVERLTVEAAAVRLGQKLSIVELRMRTAVAKLVESGRVPADLLARLAHWRHLDSVRPAKRPADRTTYRKQIEIRRRRRAARAAGGSASPGPAPADQPDSKDDHQAGGGQERQPALAGQESGE